MQNKKVKSSVAAGILGIFLGSIGVHDFYLNKKWLGTAHICLAVLSFFLTFGSIFAIAGQDHTSYSYYGYGYSYSYDFVDIAASNSEIYVALFFLGMLVGFGNAIWAFVESIIILAGGDVALARKGYAIAAPLTPVVVASPAPAQTPVPAPASAAPAPIVVAPVQPKQPMNPATKKKIVIGCIIGGVVLVAMIIIGVVVAILTHAEYGEAYRIVRDLKSDVTDLYQNYDCERVVTSADNDYVSNSNYKKYIDSCIDSTKGIGEKIDELGNTSAVRNDSKIAAQFKIFKEEYESIIPSDQDFTAKLELYSTWHSFVVVVDSLSASDTDAKIESAANILKDSGNETLAAYGEDWLEHTMAYVKAYRDYQASSYSDANRSKLREEMYTKQSDQRKWVSENEPDITELVPLNFSDTTKMYNAYTKLYGMITDAYEENYDGSGDCSEAHGLVYCS